MRVECSWPSLAAGFGDVDSPIGPAFIKGYTSPRVAPGLGAKALLVLIDRNSDSGRRGARRLGSKRLQLSPARRLVRVGGDRHMRVAADRELNHAPIVDADGAEGNGCQPASRAVRDAQRG